jgi:hypothetical protein
MVVIFVMDCELPQTLAREITPASRTYPRKNFKRPFTVALLPLLPVAPGFSNNLLQSVFVQTCPVRRHLFPFGAN